MKWSSQGMLLLVDIFVVFLWNVWIAMDYVLISFLQNWITCVLTKNNDDYFSILPKILSILFDVELTSMQLGCLFGLCSLWCEYCTWHKLLIMISMYYLCIIQIQWLFDSICLIMNNQAKTASYTSMYCFNNNYNLSSM